MDWQWDVPSTCSPRWDVHVALHELMGHNLLRHTFNVSINIPTVKLDLTLPSADPLATKSNGEANPGPPTPVLREKIFKFSESAIDKIKSTVNVKPSDGSKPFSTFQALSVHIWRHVTHLRNLKPEDYTVFTVFVDCRKRVEPPMPETYFGNLIQAISTVTK